MDYKISFAEMAVKGEAVLSKQPKLTLDQFRAQVQMLKQNSLQNQKKKGH